MSDELFIGTEYDKCKSWIKIQREHNQEWDAIIKMKTANGTEEEIQKKLNQRRDDDFWPEMDVYNWRLLVKKQKEEEEKFTTSVTEDTVVYDKNELNNVDSCPTAEWSSWKQYERKLREKGFDEVSIKRIARSTLNILKHLTNNMKETGPRKGMVIGNVQSGKTANMAALMAMGADYGWNFFILLSGTIENLREQTQKRIYSDIKTDSTDTNNWIGLEHLSLRSTGENDINNVILSDNTRNRYFTVCLKNASRLRDLLRWLHKDPNKMQQMRIIIMDDEADQASVNTADITLDERKKINELLSNLVSGKTYNGKRTKKDFQAINYIGYTATPYANILNEGPSPESLYPENFIMCLGNSNKYFGPQQIFGEANSIYEGLDIVREIKSEEVVEVANIHGGNESEIPESLKDAVCWFLCCVCAVRIMGKKMPVSMLIHTSHKVEHHDAVGKKLMEWAENPAENLVSRCSEVWQKETAAFSKKKFLEQYPDYGVEANNINDYPEFEEIKSELQELIKSGIQNIFLGDEGDLQYTDGVHLCIDNCKNNGINEDGMYMRLAYPDKGNMPDKAPAFIVIGGNTLSRGLTLEGLVTTYFLRNVGQGDSLMQMGRWFGYRVGYELLPRIWMTSKTESQFKFLSSLDSELRDEIGEMEIKGYSPSEYGPRIKNTPKYGFLRIAAKNKMQSAVTVTLDYSGTDMQTYLFSKDKEDQKNNIEQLEKLIKNLECQSETNSIESYREGCFVWKDIDFSLIKNFIESYHFSKRSKTFLEVEGLLQWLNKMTVENKLKNWNVILAGTRNKGEKWKFGDREINMVQRTKKKNVKDDINIGALISPKDFLADIEIDKIGDETLVREIKTFTSSRTKEITRIRYKAGVDDVPQLLLYVIDKNSALVKPSETRENLGAHENLVGLCLRIPGIKKGKDCTTALTINLDNNIFDDEGDVEV